MPHPERILVVPRSKLDAIVSWQGFLCSNRLSLGELLAHSELRVRDEVEDDPSFKQLIPYSVFRYRDVEATHRGKDPMIFRYRRGVGGSESRLHGDCSLGVGGHIEESDFDGDFSDRERAYHVGRRRELNEEVWFPSRHSPWFAGYINDDTTPVGRVHLGVIHCVDLSSPDVESREPGTLVDAGWISTGLLPSIADQFESWSRILIECGVLGASSYGS